MPPTRKSLSPAKKLMVCGFTFIGKAFEKIKNPLTYSGEGVYSIISLIKG
jgi:hypothetical protein